MNHLKAVVAAQAVAAVRPAAARVTDPPRGNQNITKVRGVVEVNWKSGYRRSVWFPSEMEIVVVATLLDFLGAFIFLPQVAGYLVHGGSLFVAGLEDATA